jgi:ParB family chromosome partitioning protein
VTEKTIPASAIKPSRNDRTTFAAGPLQELAESIRAHGLAQPITVRPHGDGYQIVAGERRFRAITEVLEMDALPREWVVIREMDDEQADAIMLAENMQREDLNPIEEACAYQKRIDRYGWSAEECAHKANVSGGRVRDRLKLLQLAPGVQQLIAAGQLGIGYGLAMSDLDANRQRIAMRYFEETARPTLGAFRRLCGQLLAEQAQEALFDMSRFMRETIQSEEEDEARRELRRFPVDESLPVMRGAMTTGLALEAYIATLLRADHHQAAAVVGRVYEGLLSSNLAAKPSESPLDELLNEEAPPPAQAGGDAPLSKKEYTMCVQNAQRQLSAPNIAGLLPAPSDTATYAWKCPECGTQIHGSYHELKRPRSARKCWSCMANITFSHRLSPKPPDTFICAGCKRTYSGRAARARADGKWVCPSCDGEGGLYYVGPVRQKGPAKPRLASAGRGWRVSYDGDWTWLKFDEKPDELVLSGVRALGFRWSKKRREWYATKPIAIEKLVEKTGLAAAEAAPVPKGWQRAVERRERTLPGERPGEEAPEPPREERKPGERSLEIGLKKLDDQYKRREQVAAAQVHFLLNEARRTGGKTHEQTGLERWGAMVSHILRKLDAQLVQGHKENEAQRYSWRDGDRLVMLSGENYKGGKLVTLRLLDPPPAEEPKAEEPTGDQEVKPQLFRGRPVWEVGRDEYTGAVGGPPVGIFLDCSPSQFAGMSKRAQNAYLARNNEKREKRSSAATSWSAMVVEAYDNGLFDLDTEDAHQDAKDQVRRTLSARREVAIQKRISELSAPFQSLDEVEVGDVIYWYAGALGYGRVLRKYKHSIRIHFFADDKEATVKWSGCARMHHREAEAIALDEFGCERCEYNGTINFMLKQGARDKRFAPELPQLNEAQRAKLREVEERVAEGKCRMSDGRRLLLRDVVLTKSGMAVARIAGCQHNRENAGGIMLCKDGRVPPPGANPMSIEKDFEVLYTYPELYPIPAGIKAKYVTPKEA